MSARHEVDPLSLVAALLLAALLASLVLVARTAIADGANVQAEPIVQVAIVDDGFGYLNLSRRGGGGSGVDGDDPPPLQQASASATFSNFALNGIPYSQWTACRGSGNSVDACLQMLVPDRDGDGVKGVRDLHPGAIGGDTLAFDITITNTSPAGGPVLTTFAFQSKFSESPALGSRLGDKLFSADRMALSSSAPRPLVGVKKNGTSNGLFGGKVKLICINSSDDYPSDLNLGQEHETLECAGGRTFDRATNAPVLQAADGTIVDGSNVQLPKGLLPGQSQTIRLLLDAGTDDGALQRAHGASGPSSSTGPLVGTLRNAGQFRAPEQAAECLELDTRPGDNVLEVVNYGDVKIIRDGMGNCVPSFEPFSKNQFLTIPRRNRGFTDVLDTRDEYLPGELPTVLTGNTGKFSLLDRGDLRPGELNLFEILRGFGESGDTLDPSCRPGGSREGACGGSAYVPVAEFYGLAGGRLVRQEVAGLYGPATAGSSPTLNAVIDTKGQTQCQGPGVTVKCKTTDPFEVPGTRDPGPRIGASALASFSDVEVIADDKSTIANEGGRAGGDRVRVTLQIQNTSPAGSNIYLTSFNFQSKERGLTDINDRLDGTSILGRQDLRLGAPDALGPTLEPCSTPTQTRCYDTALGIGRFPNTLGNSLLTASVLPGGNGVDGLLPGKLESIKKNGTFQPLMKSDGRAANFICIKSGAPADDQDADETCFGQPGRGLAPGESQSVRLELDYGDFRGLILRVAPGTLADGQALPFGLLPLGGDFDCRDQRRLPYCHPDLYGQDWFNQLLSLNEVEYVTVHQPGDAPSVMNFRQNFGLILAMGGFIPTAEFYQGSTQVQVRGGYLELPGGGTTPPPDPSPDPPANQLPTAVIATPQCTYLACTFDGSGSSDPDGTIVDYAWRFLKGETEVGEATGSAVSFSFLDAGTYTAQLRVTDDDGGTAQAQRSVTVSAPPPATTLSLTATPFKVRGIQHVQLDWTGSTAQQMDVYRNAVKIATVNNTGRYTDNINKKGGGSYSYKVCAQGTTVCSNQAQAVF